MKKNRQQFSRGKTIQEVFEATRDPNYALRIFSYRVNALSDAVRRLMKDDFSDMFRIIDENKMVLDYKPELQRMYLSIRFVTIPLLNETISFYENKLKDMDKYFVSK